MTPVLNDREKDMRLSQRHAIQVKVDLRPLRTQDVDCILEGQGFEDLNSNSLSMNRPRLGMDRCEAVDISASGVRLRGAELAPGTAALMDLHLPDEGVVVKALVEVVWVKEVEKEPYAGVRFAAMPEQGARRVRSFLSNIGYVA